MPPEKVRPRHRFGTAPGPRPPRRRPTIARPLGQVRCTALSSALSPRRSVIALWSASHANASLSHPIDLLRKRRSLKPVELVEPGPSPSELDTLLTIASRVPDHGKLTPWRFIVFAGPARLKAGEAIAAAFAAKYPDAKAEQIDFERNRLTRAPLVIAVVSRAAPHAKIPEWEQVLSSGAAAMNLAHRGARARLRSHLDHRMVRL